MLKRLGIALAIALALYGVGLGIGSLLYATGNIPTGATHNDCEDFAKTLAPQYGGDEEDVPQSAIKQLAETCLAGHELEEEDAYREEFVLWAAWPAVICALIFLAWPWWSRLLANQERADPHAEAREAITEEGV